MENWIIPCNIKYYDVDGAFEKLHCLDWKQSAGKIEVGDYVYIYLGSPVSAIKYKCRVNKVNLSSIEIDDSEFVINGDNYLSYHRHMELELVRKYDDELTLPVLKKGGLNGNIQGPRRMSPEIATLADSVQMSTI